MQQLEHTKGKSSTSGSSGDVYFGYMHRVKRKVPSQSSVSKILEKKIEKGEKADRQKAEDSEIQRDTQVVCREAY